MAKTEALELEHEKAAPVSLIGAGIQKKIERLRREFAHSVGGRDDRLCVAKEIVANVDGKRFSSRTAINISVTHKIQYL